MKSLTIIFSCITTISLILFLSKEKQPEKQPASIEYFKQGQILLPDYACNDTLIVRDADGLNKAIAYVEQYNDTLVETDSEIDSLFHVYCDYYTGSYEDQFTKLKALQPTWDSLQIDAAIKED